MVPQPRFQDRPPKSAVSNPALSQAALSKPALPELAMVSALALPFAATQSCRSGGAVVGAENGRSVRSHLEKEEDHSVVSDDLEQQTLIPRPSRYGICSISFNTLGILPQKRHLIPEPETHLSSLIVHPGRGP